LVKRHSSTWLKKGSEEVSIYEKSEHMNIDELNGAISRKQILKK
jgi:hypothetical protein